MYVVFKLSVEILLHHGGSVWICKALLVLLVLLVLLLVVFEFARHFAISSCGRMCVSAPPSSTWNWRTLVDSRSLDISSLHNCRYQTHLGIEISFLPPPISSWPTYHKHKPNWNGMDKAWSKAAYLQVLYFEIWQAFVGRTSRFLFGVENTGRESAG